MMCTNCGNPLKDPVLGGADYPCGLQVRLEGVRIRECTECDEREVEVPNIAGLHEELVRVIAESRRRLHPEEIRFLRKHLGWSGRDFASAFEVTPETVSKWEHGKRVMNVNAERLLRMIAVLNPDLEDYDELDEKGGVCDHADLSGRVSAALEVFQRQMKGDVQQEDRVPNMQLHDGSWGMTAG